MMERLTIRTPKGAALKMNDTYPNEKAARSDLMRRYLIAVDRLAAYEDTGLEPEEVKEFLDDVESRFILWVNKEYRVSAGRHIDIMQAEKEGRLTILPKELIQLSTKEAYIKMAEDYEREAEKWDRNIAALKARAHRPPRMEESEEISKAMDIRDEMRINARAMRRRAEKVQRTKEAEGGI